MRSSPLRGAWHDGESGPSSDTRARASYLFRVSCGRIRRVRCADRPRPRRARRTVRTADPTKLDLRPHIELLLVFAHAPHAVADLAIVVHDLDRPQELDHLEPELGLEPRPHRRAVL